MEVKVKKMNKLENCFCRKHGIKISRKDENNKDVCFIKGESVDCYDV